MLRAFGLSKEEQHLLHLITHCGSLSPRFLSLSESRAFSIALVPSSLKSCPSIASLKNAARRLRVWSALLTQQSHG